MRSKSDVTVANQIQLFNLSFSVFSWCVCVCVCLCNDNT